MALCVDRHARRLVTAKAIALYQLALAYSRSLLSRIPFRRQCIRLSISVTHSIPMSLVQRRGV